jgi:hypothetical protein
VRGVRQTPHETGIDQADQADEYADADRDRRFQRRRDGSEHGRPEAGENEQHDDEALDDDQAHRFWPGHLRRDGDRDQAVDAEPGGDGEGLRTVRGSASVCDRTYVLLCG